VAKQDLLLRALEKTRFGELTLVTPDGATRHFAGSDAGEAATMIVKDWGAVDAILARGDIGLGESYMEAQWESPDLQAFLTFCQRNRDEFANLTRFDLLNKVISRVARRSEEHTF